eukprot:1309655-Rhodomonas_salina.1
MPAEVTRRRRRRKTMRTRSRRSESRQRERRMTARLSLERSAVRSVVGVVEEEGKGGAGEREERQSWSLRRLRVRVGRKSARRDEERMSGSEWSKGGLEEDERRRRRTEGRRREERRRGG